MWYDNIENQEWVEQFKSMERYSEEKEGLLMRYTDGSFLCYSNTLWQQKFLPWDVVYKLLHVFDGFDLRIKFPVSRASFNEESFIANSQLSSLSSFLKDGYIETFSTEINRNGDVDIMFRVESGSRGDEDGFGVEPDIWAFGVIGADGQIVVPFHF